MVDVSFFVPVYKPNREWLKETVASIVELAAKSSVSCEILLGDDGSPDGCFELLQKLEKDNPAYVRAFSFPENRGVGITSCALADLSRGRYIASFDQDDIMLPFDLDRVVKFMDEHPEYGSSYAQKYLFNDSGLTGEIHGDHQSDFLTFFQPKVNINAMLIRREVLFAHGSFRPLPNSRIFHDVFLMLRLGGDTLLHFDREHPRALYRSHSSQNSTVIGNGQENWQLMGQYIISCYPELYRKIIMDDQIPAGKDIEEKRLIQKLSGLALFLNQQNNSLMWKIIEHAVKAEPDDYGAREILLQLLNTQKDHERFLKEYEKGMQLFSDNDDVQFIYTNIAYNHVIKFGGEIENLRTVLNSLHKKCKIPPEIVTANVPKSKKVSYSWNF